MDAIDFCIADRVIDALLWISREFTLFKDQWSCMQSQHGAASWWPRRLQAQLLDFKRHVGGLLILNGCWKQEICYGSAVSGAGTATMLAHWVTKENDKNIIWQSCDGWMDMEPQRRCINSCLFVCLFDDIGRAINKSSAAHPGFLQWPWPGTSETAALGRAWGPPGWQRCPPPLPSCPGCFPNDWCPAQRGPPAPPRSTSRSPSTSSEVKNRKLLL